MPGKARHKKSKHSIQSKKRSGQPVQPAALAPPPTVAQTREPSPPPRAAMPPAKSAVIQSPRIATELWTIGILTGIMLLILFVLAMVPLPF